MTVERQRIDIAEYGSAIETLTQHDLRELLEVGDKSLEIRPTGDASQYRITAGSKVGTIATSRLEVQIRPKIPLENLFVLLEPAVVPIDMRAETIGFGRYEDLTPAFAAFFARLLEQTLARGMRRDYVPVEDSLVALRGRLDMSRQVRSPVLTPLACRFDEHSIDTPHNRILKAAALRLVRLPGIGEQNRDALRHLLMWFGEVADSPPPTRAVLRRGFTRLDAQYEPAVRLACMVIDGASLAHEFGEITANTFLIDMNRTFEKFLEVRLAAALRGRLQVSPQHPVHLDVDRRVRMAPDLVFLRAGSPAYVGDAKYKVVSDVSGVDADLYQLLAYTTALGLPEGVLVYAEAGDHVPAGEVDVALSDKRLHVRRIDLLGDAASIRTAIDDLATWVLSRAVAVPASEEVDGAPTDDGLTTRTDDRTTAPEWRMAKYDSLAQHLDGIPTGQLSVSMTFAEVAALVGGLPPTAYKLRQWWANDSKSQACAWRSAGWHVDTNGVDLNAQTVRFARGRVGGTRARRLGLE